MSYVASLTCIFLAPQFAEAKRQLVSKHSLMLPEFQFPASWLADQRIAQRTAARIEAENPLDPPPVQGQKRRAPAEPIVAFGPAGTK